MEKHDIVNIIRSAIIDVSPYAADILARRGSKIQDIFFVDLGINSIDYAQVALTVMEELDIDIALDIFASTNSIGDVVNIFYGQVAVEA